MSARIHSLTVVSFVALTVVGHVYGGGVSFLEAWSGSIAAVIATAFLVTKSQGYRYWMVVNSALWFSLFLHEQLPMLAWLQMSFLLLCAYGLVRGALVQRSRIGYLGTTLDRWGVALAAGVFVWSIVTYCRMPGYALSTWWVEFGSVVSNVFSGPLFLPERLWGPFLTLFAYQAINVVGWFVWMRDEARLAYA